MRSGSVNSTLPTAGGVARPVWVTIQTVPPATAATSGMAIRAAMSPPVGGGDAAVGAVLPEGRRTERKSYLQRRDPRVFPAPDPHPDRAGG